jgi:hypothetical protein
MALWGITSFFNPSGYSSRLRNYGPFRRHLPVPLVAVELSHDGCFQLGPADADILVQVEGRDVMWQKERLLNLALDALPADCDEVAWLDCDILFERPDWPERATRLLDDFAMVQLFDRVHYLGPEYQPGDPVGDAVERTRPSIASGVTAGSPPEACLSHPSPGQRPGTYNNGMAWAARRDLLGRHRFFDASIVGGGDRAMSCGAYGCFEHLFEWHAFNTRQGDYYLRWAEPFSAACGGRIAALEGAIHHLWHGSAADRGLGSRHAGLRPFAFDPFEDIAHGEGECWRWNTEKPDLHAYVRSYFGSRREDG